MRIGAVFRMRQRLRFREILRATVSSKHTSNGTSAKRSRGSIAHHPGRSESFEPAGELSSAVRQLLKHTLPVVIVEGWPGGNEVLADHRHRRVRDTGDDPEH